MSRSRRSQRKRAGDDHGDHGAGGGPEPTIRARVTWRVTAVTAGTEIMAGPPGERGGHGGHGPHVHRAGGPSGSGAWRSAHSAQRSVKRAAEREEPTAAGRRRPHHTTPPGRAGGQKT